METKIILLQSLLTHTFLCTTRKNYLIEFKNSNVIDEMDAIYTLDAKLRSRAQTRQRQKEVRNVSLIIETYTYLIGEYLKKYTITKLPSNLKRYTMVKELLSVSPSAVKQIDDLHKKFITPITKTLTYKERIRIMVNADMVTNLSPKRGKKK